LQTFLSLGFYQFTTNSRLNELATNYLGYKYAPILYLKQQFCTCITETQVQSIFMDKKSF